MICHPCYIALLGATFLFINYLYRTIQRRLTHRRFNRQYGCQPAPSLPSKPPFWSLGVIVRNIQAAKRHKSLETIHKLFQLGNTLTGQRLGQPVLVTCEPQNIQTILSLKFQDYKVGDRVNSQGPLLAHGIFTSDGDSWAQSRALIRPTFVRERVADLALFEEIMADLFALLPVDGRTVDLQPLFFSYTLDSITHFAFGHSVHNLRKSQARGNDADHEVAEAFNYSMQALALRSKLGLLRVFHRDRKATRSYKICHQFVEGLVHHAVMVPEKVGDNRDSPQRKGQYLVLHELVRQTKDRIRVRDELINVLIAGRDTTAGLLSNLFFVLAKRPDVWAKLRAEVETTLGGRLPTYDDLRNMKYLRHCLNESLRLHPAVPTNSRVATNDTYLPIGGGLDGQSPVFVPKGALVVYSVYAMHRREDIYGSDADDFRPERWETIRPSWGYLPFNGGPRICLGQQYALTEASYVTVRLAQRYKTLVSRDPGPWEEHVTLTLRSRNGTQVSLGSA
ncbi:cytochrome P450 [Aspergillus minisclerotigenes]|uniref:Cytochrome P450 n=1 Tax=Aspergillus minisclerotigenes TaxID=656917 RepID=A0A5N6J1F7_9EURO|nr:cytochrome P450 [Aspergillus minisclerotigenes]